MSKANFGGLKHGPCPNGPRAHVKKMADGGMVKKYADGGKTKKKKKKKAEADPALLGTGMASKAGEAIKNTRKKQMEELGI